MIPNRKKKKGQYLQSNSISFRSEIHAETTKPNRDRFTLLFLHFLAGQTNTNTNKFSLSLTNLQVGVKAPGTPKRTTFLPAARECTDTVWSSSSSLKYATFPSGSESPTAIGAICCGVDRTVEIGAGTEIGRLRIGHERYQ